MNNIINNYPIKYAVLEVQEKGGWAVGYEDVTKGFIASKCFVVETKVVYGKDGKSKVINKVVFPYEDYSFFEHSLSRGIKNLGIMNSINYDANNNPYPSHIVNELYETFDEAKEKANKCNEDYKVNLINRVSFSEPSWQYQYELLKNDFDKTSSLCNLFEQLIESKTRLLEISKEEKGFIKILKP